MIKRILRYPYRIALKQYNYWQTHQFITKRIKTHKLNIESFNFILFKQTTLNFLKTLQVENSIIKYKYAASCKHSTLYASAYACMTYSLLNELEPAHKKDWISYFDSFQDSKDGLFYDPAVSNKHFNDSDWWGARHLALHMISAYTDLSARPKYPFLFLKKYYDAEFLQHWFEENEVKFEGDMDHDFDNKLMNIACLLQYQRDFWNDEGAGKAVVFIQEYLLRKINPITGIWGDSNIHDPAIRSRKVQFAYHLLPFFLYDNIHTFDFKKIADITLKTQNKFGGFGVMPNASACEDIDSIDILIRATNLTDNVNSAVQGALETSFKWITTNQVDDGGFVFRLNDKFVYGHLEMSSLKNEGAVFPTWFRTLSVAYLCKYFKLNNDFKITRCPGYEF